jgi:hypothetical protein
MPTIHASSGFNRECRLTPKRMQSQAFGCVREEINGARISVSSGNLAFLTLAQPVKGEDARSSIVGFWKMASFTSKVVETDQTRLPYGEHPGGYTAFSRDGHIVHLVLNDDRKAPAGRDVTDAERAELFKTIAAFSGTYKVEGNKIIFHYEATWIQSRTGTDDVRTFETSGKKLTISSSPIKSGLDGKEVVNTWTLERIE